MTALPARSKADPKHKADPKQIYLLHTSCPGLEVPCTKHLLGMPREYAKGKEHAAPACMLSPLDLLSLLGTLCRWAAPPRWR
jgi:hypothetical protein